MCVFAVNCSSLTNPNNGVINCSLGDDGVSSYEDTCSFTCNTGYELTGSDTRTCQSNGSWNGRNVTCGRGNYYIIATSMTFILFMYNIKYLLLQNEGLI